MSQLMDDHILEKFIQEYIASQPQENILFIWHGGETLLRKISFYRRALELQAKYASGHKIENCIQTNGTMLNEEWCKFFRDNRFLVGISIDGPGRFHDEYRRDKLGNPTFLRVLRGINLLNRYGVEWNAMAVVNDINSKHPLEFYRFFRDKLGCRFLQFTPIVERLDNNRLSSPLDREGEIAPFPIAPQQWGEFLCSIFDEWVKRDVGEMFVQIFDATLANWVGVTPGVCTLAPRCGYSPVIEHNGDIYSCDHYVFPSHKVGNLLDNSFNFKSLLNSQIRFGTKKTVNLPSKCRQCRFLFACNGECPKNRIIKTDDGESGLNYLCDGYYRYFLHVSPYMDYMKNEYLNGRPPSNVMQWDANTFFLRGNDVANLNQ